MKEILKDYIHFFGYTNVGEFGKNSLTSFFSVEKGLVTKDRIDGYKIHNQTTLHKKPQNLLIGVGEENAWVKEPLPKIQHEKLTVEE